MTVNHIIQSINEHLTFFVVFPLMTIFGIYLTIRLRFIQFFKLKLACKHLIKKEKNAEGDISHFEALSAVLAGNLGTGNISGVAIALTFGGPGAVIWMWFMAFMGAIINYAGCFLGVKYRQKNENNEYVGGPMYYLHKGLRLKSVAVGFALFTIVSSLTAGNLVQVNSINLPLQALGVSPYLIGFSMLIFTFIVIIGGMKRIAKVVSAVVPLMTFMYLIGACIILFFFRKEIIPAFSLIFACAFKPSSAAGGLLGFGLIKVVSSGFERAIFATDAGTGLVPVLQSSARTKSPVLEGVISMIAPFFVMVICTITGLILIVTGAWNINGLESTNMCIWAFKKGLHVSRSEYPVIIALFLFAFTTILAWCCCAEKAVAYLFGTHRIRTFQLFFVAMIPIGVFASVDIVWALADISIACMLICNMIGIIGLSEQVINESHAYFSEPAPSIN